MGRPMPGCRLGRSRGPSGLARCNRAASQTRKRIAAKERKEHKRGPASGDEGADPDQSTLCAPPTKVDAVDLVDGMDLVAPSEFPQAVIQ